MNMAAGPLYLHTSSTSLLFKFGVELLKSLASTGEATAHRRERVLQGLGNFAIGEPFSIEQQTSYRGFRQARQQALDQITLPNLFFKMLRTLQILFTRLIKS